MHGMTLPPDAANGSQVRPRPRISHVVVGLVLLLAKPAAAQTPGLGASVELVDPKVFRVCADPHNLPLSDEQGAGFENKIAELFAKKLSEPTNYTYFPQVIGFLRNTLNALRCDVVIGTAVGDTTVQTTNPYYRTTYALLFKPEPRSGWRRLAWRSAPEGQAHRYRCRYAPGNHPDAGWPDGFGKALSSDCRYACYLVAGDDDE